MLYRNSVLGMLTLSRCATECLTPMSDGTQNVKDPVSRITDSLQAEQNSIQACRLQVRFLPFLKCLRDRGTYCLDHIKFVSTSALFSSKSSTVQSVTVPDVPNNVLSHKGQVQLACFLTWSWSPLI